MLSATRASDTEARTTPSRQVHHPLAPAQEISEADAQSGCCSSSRGCRGSPVQCSDLPATVRPSLELNKNKSTCKNPAMRSEREADIRNPPDIDVSVQSVSPALLHQAQETASTNFLTRYFRMPTQPKFTLPTLQKMAIGISVASILYNGAEGAVSITLGKEDQSKALIFFGIQSFVEVASASLVVWRFANIALPGNEQVASPSPDNIRKERIATVSIGALLGLLSTSAWGVSIEALVRHERPTSSLPGLIISATALGLMIAIWLPKPWLAKALDSSAMRGEAKCSLACISMTAALLTGTAINKAWQGGWWVDSATNIALGLFFAKESVEMIRWGLDKKFSGSCCRTCAPAVKQV